MGYSCKFAFTLNDTYNKVFWLYSENELQILQVCQKREKKGYFIIPEVMDIGIIVTFRSNYEVKDKNKSKNN